MKLDTNALRRVDVPMLLHEEVLDELDGPQLITIEDQGGKRFLGILIDTDDNGTLWLLGRLPEHSWRALVEGRASLRAVVLAPGSLIVGRDWNNDAVAAWVAPLPTKEHEDGGLGEAFLPEKGALLPTATRERLVRALRPTPEPPALDDRIVEEGSKDFVRVPTTEHERAA